MGIFSSEQMHKLLHNKFVLLIGDSVQRSIYKDLVVLWHENRFVKDKELRAKGEKSFLGDSLVFRSELTNGVNYREVREFKSDHILIRFYFATRVYNEYIESVLKQYEEENEHIPDVVLLNSCLWDITRYGKKGWNNYQANLEKFFSRVDDIVPAQTCIIWRTTLPVSRNARGGFLASDSVRNKDSLVVDVLLANYLAHAVAVRHKYDVIDMHFMFTCQQQRRAKDGIHWNMFAHRRMTNIVLSHVSEAWGLGVPSHPVQQSDDFAFDRTDISMNTTEVLQCAYPSSQTLSDRQRINEERYGGPVRSSEEMYNIYTRFYQAPLNNQHSHYAGQENTAPFRFDPYATAAPSRHVAAFDDYWSQDEPLASYHRQPDGFHAFREFAFEVRRIGWKISTNKCFLIGRDLPTKHSDHANVQFKYSSEVLVTNTNAQWKPQVFGKKTKQTKAKKRKNRGYQPYNNRRHGVK